MQASKVDRVVHVKPDRCRGCRGRLKGSDPQPQRHQVVEIPPVEPEVTEYRLHSLGCRCGLVTTAELPRGVSPGILGARLQAIVAYFTGRARMSKRLIQDALADLLGVQISLGAIKAAEQRVSAALGKPVQEATEYIREQKAVHVDETSWKEGNGGKNRKGRAWLWVAATCWVTIFQIHRRRGFDALVSLLRGFTGYLISDRWVIYECFSPWKRQLCWSHLLRDFQGFVDRGHRGARKIGKALLSEAELMFSLWHRVRDGTLKRSSFQKLLRPIRVRVKRHLRQGARRGDKKARATCRDLLRLFPALWTFSRVIGVEPTNNFAERVQRNAVIYRKSSFGTQSAAGSRFIERIFSVVATLRQQKRNVLDYLTRACEAANYGRRWPTLLPARALRAAA